MAATAAGRVLLCIPTLNAGGDAARLLRSLELQTVRPDDFLVVDSGSTDGTPELFQRAGARLLHISPGSFSHGGTRQLAVDTAPPAEFVVFLTQDVELAGPDALAALLAVFSDRTVGAAYGRQLPRERAAPIEAHARLFNYPAASQIRSRDDIPALGFRAAFMSNSFGAYRTSALREAGGFPAHIPMGEDSWVAGAMLLAGWRVAYCAEAAVYHSHPYGAAAEFRRYFDIGRFHARASWLLATFGTAGSEGGRFVRSELAYLMCHAPASIPAALVRTLLKSLGYWAGRRERLLPRKLVQVLGMVRPARER